jgi:hypothetical protein
MKWMEKSALGIAAFLAVLALTSSPRAVAQQVTGTPGSPSATTSLDGKQLPPPPAKFGGVIKEDAKDSTPWWPPRVVPLTTSDRSSCRLKTKRTPRKNSRQPKTNRCHLEREIKR